MSETPRKSIRQSIEPTYDSRETGPRYHVTYKLNGRVVTWQERLDDPFVRAVLRVSWRDRLRSLLQRDMEVEVLVSADPELIEDVMELNSNYLGPGQNTRRIEFNEGIGKSINRFLKERDAIGEIEETP